MYIYLNEKILLILSICLFNLINGDMNYICDNIFLGDSKAAGDEAFLKRNNITAVINCAREYISEYKEIKFIELDINDESYKKIIQKFEIAYKFIKEYQENYILMGL